MTKRNKVRGAATALLTIATAAITAGAADSKAYTGVFCKGITPTYQDLLEYVSGGWVEAGAGTANIMCPAIRDVQAGSTDLDYAYVEVWNNTAASGTHPSCTLYAMDEDANSGVVEGTSTTDTYSPSGRGSLSLDFGSATTSNSGAVFEGSYFLDCRLGAGDRLYQYSILEN